MDVIAEEELFLLVWSVFVCWRLDWSVGVGSRQASCLLVLLLVSCVLSLSLVLSCLFIGAACARAWLFVLATWRPGNSIAYCSISVFVTFTRLGHVVLADGGVVVFDCVVLSSWREVE